MTSALRKDLSIFMTVSRLLFLKISNVSEKIAAKFKTHILRLILLFPENRAVYEIIQKIQYRKTGHK
jgi:hypothetical protein